MRADRPTITSNEFLKCYIDAIACAGRALDSREWWATNIASKNRFTSRMAELLSGEAVPKPWLGQMMGRIHQAVRIVVSAISSILHCFQSRWYLREKTKRLRKTDGSDRYVIKTFVYNHSFDPNGNYRDVFFGELPQILKDRGETVLVYAVILGDRSKCLRLMAQCPNFTIIPVELFCAPKMILWDALRLLLFRFPKVEKILFDGANMASILHRELSGTLNDIPPFQYFHYRFVESLAKAVKIQTFLQTGENNPWERMCIMALRKHSPKARILSYQHAVVPQASANMFAGRGEAGFAPLPDQLLTTGPEPKRIIEFYGDYPPGFVVSACGLRYAPAAEPDKVRADGKSIRTLLLALEGIPKVAAMVQYAASELAGHRRYRMIVRTHPSLPFEKLRRYLAHPWTMPENIELSVGQSLAADIKRSDAVLYWGTTVALEALREGRPVIHFDMGTGLSYDPLFDFTRLKRTVRRQDPLVPVLDSIFDLPDTEFQADLVAARVYLEKYFAPVNAENLTPFFKGAGN